MVSSMLAEACSCVPDITSQYMCLKVVYWLLFVTKPRRNKFSKVSQSATTMYEYSSDFLVAVYNTCTAVKSTKKSNVFPAHATNACRRPQAYLTLILQLCIRSRYLVKFTSQLLYPWGGGDIAMVNVVEN